MTERELEEYRALRATIRERGTSRVWIFVVGFGLWGGLAIATTTLVPLPEATLLPLLVLAGVFEAIFALHTGVERIGRYIQVFHEHDATAARWEHTAMAIGTTAPWGPGSPLFGRFFALATVVNFVPAVLAGALPIEWTSIGVAHVALVLRVALAERHSARQRALDLDRFQQLQRANGQVQS